MKLNESENALKGQQILAQGNALGLWTSREIVRAVTFIKEKFMLRTKKMSSCFPKMMFCNSLPVAGRRPKWIICFVHRTHADGFLRIPFPLGVTVQLSAHAEARG
jgi:hypothetical protein